MPPWHALVDNGDCTKQCEKTEGIWQHAVARLSALILSVRCPCLEKSRRKVRRRQVSIEVLGEIEPQDFYPVL